MTGQSPARRGPKLTKGQYEQRDQYIYDMMESVRLSNRAWKEMMWDLAEDFGMSDSSIEKIHNRLFKEYLGRVREAARKRGA